MSSPKKELLRPQIEPDADAIRAELARRNLKDFIRAGWHVLEPGNPFQDGWHIDIICEHLEAVTSGELRNLIINIPPGFMKSRSVCVFWPCWHWINLPSTRFSFSSYSAGFSARDSKNCRELILSEWYRRHFGGSFTLKYEAVDKLENSKQGTRIASHVGGLTGERADINVLDDPHNIDEIYSDTIRTNVNTWVEQTWWSRVNDPRTCARVCIMQRVHEDDACAKLMEKEHFEQLVIPLEYDRRRVVTNSMRWQDPRKADGELLWPARYSREYCDRWKVRLGKYGASGQLQQRPTPPEGGTLRRDAWRRYRVPPAHFDQIAIFGDLTFEGEETAKNPAYNSIQVWGLAGANKYWLDLYYDKAEYSDVETEFRALCKRWPTARAKVFEDKANAAALKSNCRKTIPGIILFPKDIKDCPDHIKSLMGRQDKMARVSYVAAEQEAGNIWLPEDSVENPCRFSKHLDEFIEQAATFKTSRYKDLIDTFSIMVLYFSIRGNSAGGDISSQYRSAGARSHNLKQSQGAY